MGYEEIGTALALPSDFSQAEDVPVSAKYRTLGARPQHFRYSPHNPGDYRSTYSRSIALTQTLVGTGCASPDGSWQSDLVPEGWTEIAYLEPTDPDADRMAEIFNAVSVWLASHSLTRDDVRDEDLGIDLIYLGPDRATCATRVSIRDSAISPT
jgi:hypothetical protein